MTEKTFDTSSASSSFSVTKAARHVDELQGASKLLPNWLRNWRTPEVLLRLLSPIALLLLWELASQAGLIPQRVIAAPSQIGGTLWAMITSGELGKHLLVYRLVFKQLLVVVSQELPAAEPPAKNMRLSRIPMVADQKVSFVDTADVLSLESQAHYTRVLTREGYHFCNLSIGDLALRLDPAQFMRVHRCFIVNLDAVQSLGREGSKTHILLKGKNTQAVPVSRGEVARLREALGLS